MTSIENRLEPQIKKQYVKRDTSKNYIYVLKQDTETEKINVKIVLGDHTDYHHECKLHMVKYTVIKRLISTQRHNRLFTKTEEKKRVPLDSWNQLYKMCKGKTFTYVFRKTDGHMCLFLCETGPAKLDDIICKHAWLAVRSGLLSDSGICCAGRCTFQEDTLFMDNMSGTYVPEEEHLVNMIGYLKKRLRTQNITPIIMISKPNLVFKHLDDKTAYTKFFKRSPDYKFAKSLRVLLDNQKDKKETTNAPNRIPNSHILEYNTQVWQRKYEHDIKRTIQKFYAYKPYYVIGPSECWVFNVLNLHIIILGDDHDDEDVYTVNDTKDKSVDEIAFDVRNNTHVHIKEWILLYILHFQSECCDIFTEHVDTSRPHTYTHPSHLSTVLNMFNEGIRQYQWYDRFPHFRYHTSDVRLYSYNIDEGDYVLEYSDGNDLVSNTSDAQLHVLRLKSIITYIIRLFIYSVSASLSTSALSSLLSYFKEDEIRRRVHRLLLDCRKRYKDSIFYCADEEKYNDFTVHDKRDVFITATRESVNSIESWSKLTPQLYIQYVCSDIQTLCRMFRVRKRRTKNTLTQNVYYSQSDKVNHIIAYTGYNHSRLYVSFISIYFDISPCVSKVSQLDFRSGQDKYIVLPVQI